MAKTPDSTKKTAKKATRKVAKSERAEVFAMRISPQQREIIQEVPKAQAALLFELACRAYNESFHDFKDQLPGALAGGTPMKSSQKLDSFRHVAVELGPSVTETYQKIKTQVEEETGVSFPIATLASIAANAVDPEYLRSLVLSLAAEVATVTAS